MKLFRQRKNLRCKHYNYNQTGWYFVTICIKNNECLLGRIINEKIELSNIGKIVDRCWKEIPKHFPNTTLDKYIIMPNHLHGIVVIESEPYNTTMPIQPVGNRHACSTRIHSYIRNSHGCSLHSRQYHRLPAIIGSFKSSVTRSLQKKFNVITFSWQKSYYDHIIRNETSLNKIREYIINNPINWKFDSEYYMS